MELTSIRRITSEYEYIALQPHFDDGALSCGGTLSHHASMGRRCLVVTVFGGTASPGTPLSYFGRAIHAAMAFGDSIEEAVARRKWEDKKACGTLGVDYLWLDFPEALYRGYDNYDAIFGGSIDDSDYYLEKQVSGNLADVFDLAHPVRVYAPLGIGNHVDHKLVNVVTRSLMSQSGIDVHFYEDFPYAAIAGSTDCARRDLGPGLQQTLVDVSTELERKVNAILCYHSQVPFLFSTLLHQALAPGTEHTRLREMVENYSCSLRPPQTTGFFERFWAYE